MNHYIKIFLGFALVNYVFLYGYDNYYLVSLEEEYILDARDQLRQHALDIKKELTQSNENETETINLWSSQQNIPSKIRLRKEMNLVSEVSSQLDDFDYAIDLYADYGPTVYINLANARLVEVGPIDPLYIESTTLQFRFISLHFIVNAVVAFIFFKLFRRKALRIENALNNLLDQESISHKLLGNQDLLRSVSNRLLKLDKYIQKIEDTNFQTSNDQRDLMHAVAHELRSPIARFSFALELAEDNNPSDEQVKLFNEMHESIDELESLIKEILSYSRLSYGRIKLNIETIELFKLTKSTIAKLETLYPQQNFELISQLERINIEGDRRFLERALINLLRNAARFANSKIELTILSDSSNLTIIVDDDGIGVPPGKRERIFEAFTRLDPSRSRDSGGVGLGLAIVKKVVDKHHGKIVVADSPLGGARFLMQLPMGRSE